MNANTTTSLITEDQIARCAYEMWEREGRPSGRDMEHWFQAEAFLRTSLAPSVSPQAKPPLTARPRRTSGSKATNTGKRDKKFEMVS